MEVKQINLKMSENLHLAAENYAKNFGFRNIQELIAESLREKIFENNNYDDSFTEKEITLIDSIIEKSVEKGDFSTEEKMNKILLE